MPVWICPNAECTFDKQLEPSQRCPLCRREAQAFNFNEFGTLLKEKWRYKKSIQKVKQRKQIAKRIKFCPKCGSSNVNLLPFYRPSMWRCLNCGYEGALMMLEDDTSSEKNTRGPKKQVRIAYAKKKGKKA